MAVRKGRSRGEEKRRGERERERERGEGEKRRRKREGSLGWSVNGFDPIEESVDYCTKD